MYTYAELVRGDLDLDGNFSAADVVLELNKVFLNQSYPALAPAGDVNCDSQFTASDVVLLLNRVFLEAPLPCTD